MTEENNKKKEAEIKENGCYGAGSFECLQKCNGCKDIREGKKE